MLCLFSQPRHHPYVQRLYQNRGMRIVRPDRYVHCSRSPRRCCRFSTPSPSDAARSMSGSAASHHETTLVRWSLTFGMSGARRENLIGDPAALLVPRPGTQIGRSA